MAAASIFDEGRSRTSERYLHVCKFVRELTNIQIRTVTAEGELCSECICPTNVVQLNERTNERTKARTRRRERKKERRKERRTREKAREKEQLPREREKALDSIRPETNNSVLS